jgi:uncharacterized membrane protein
MGTAINESTRTGSRAAEQTRGVARTQRGFERQHGNGGERGNREGLASALGWFSVGLGVAQIITPGRLARLVGIEDSDRSREVMRALGLRELASGIGILAQPRPARWVWGRVAGDAIDLALLGRAMTGSTERRRTGAAAAAVLGVTALDAYCARELTRAKRAGEEHGIHVVRAITVNRPVEEIYSFWRAFENFPRFMRHLEEVRDLGNGRSHWKVRAPAGMSVEWDAEVVEDVPNERISWRSEEGSEIPNEGTVSFLAAPGGRGTEVVVELRYDPPAGKVGQLFAKLFREEPGQQVYDDLRAFKQVLETGEVMVSDATLRDGPHPAHPPGELGGRVSSTSRAES